MLCLTELHFSRHEAELRSGTLTAAEVAAREEIGALRATVAALEAQVWKTRVIEVDFSPYSFKNCIF